MSELREKIAAIIKREFRAETTYSEPYNEKAARLILAMPEIAGALHTQATVKRAVAAAGGIVDGSDIEAR